MLEKEEMKVEKGAKQKEKLESKEKLNQKRERAITLIALVITIALNCVRSGRKLEYTA